MLESIHRVWFTASVRLYTTHTNKYSNSHICTKSCTVKFRCKSSYLLFIFNTYVSYPQVSSGIFYFFFLMLQYYFHVLLSQRVSLAFLSISLFLSLSLSLLFSLPLFSSLFIIDSSAFWAVYNASFALYCVQPRCVRKWEWLLETWYILAGQSSIRKVKMHPTYPWKEPRLIRLFQFEWESSAIS